MSYPDVVASAPDSGQTSAAILIELGKQSTQLAVINTKLDQLASVKEDHEARLRAVEAQGQQDRGGRDILARVGGLLGLLVAVAATIATYVHH